MKKAAIISVGTEIMRGKMDDTNSTFISRWLSNIGIRVKLRINTDDKIDDIVRMLVTVRDCDLVILFGGLGPTDDDLTREAFAEFIGEPLVFQEKMWKEIQQLYKKWSRKIPDSNKKQAMLVANGEFIKNSVGTAPGIYYENKKQNKIYALFPGPPRENQKMIAELLLKKLQNNRFIEGEIYTKAIRLYNVGESEIADLLGDIELTCEIGSYFDTNGWLELHLSQYRMDRNEPVDKVDNSFRNLKEALDERDIFYTGNIDLGVILSEMLIEKDIKLSFAESITGGNLSGELVKNPGVSKIFPGSIIAYSNDIKKDILMVSDDTLKKFGAVSENTVKEMVIGLKEKVKADIYVAVSGIAGPDGGSHEKPIGLTYFGFIFDDNLLVKKEIFVGNRERIIRRCINFIYIEIIKYIESNRKD